ncbi:MAG: PAS domain S-box protein, partial [Alphaproteobacteria bacterium]|nr:PAS domain S-box protein [Alphaproteobacteria bacterium]
MRDRTIFYLAGLTLLSVFVLWVGWEFVVEDVIWPLFWSDYEEESVHHRWEYVISATIFTGIALIIPTLVSLRSIAERARAEEALRESEERFRNLVEGALQGILIHRHHIPLFVNRAWADIHGYAPEEVLAMDSVVPHIALSDRARLVGYKDARLRGEDAPDRYEYQAVKKDGSTIHLVNHVRIVRWGGQPAIQTTVIDITERKQAERELEESRELLRALTDNLPQFISLKDTEGRFQFVNKRFEEWTNFGRDDVVGKTVHDIYPAEQAACFAADDQEALDSRSILVQEFDLSYPDGHTRTVVSTRFPIKSQVGDLIGLGTINYDITERKRVEEALRESEERFRAVVDHSPGAIVIKDMEGRNLIANKAFC